MLIDTHAHLDEQAFDTDRAEVIQRARDAGVEAILTIGITAQTSQAAVRLAEEFDEVLAVVGIQPNYVSQAESGDWQIVEELAGHPRVVGIGETGLDRYWDYAPFQQQVEYFDRHLQLSRDVGKPFVVHCREAETEVVEQLRRTAEQHELHGVMHSFCGNAETASACMEVGMSLSFAGMLTYKKSEPLREVAATIPHDRLLIETDAPYLVPNQARESKKKGGLGIKRNEPAFLRFTAAILAEAVGLEEAELGQVTSKNARQMFGLTPSKL